MSPLAWWPPPDGEPIGETRVSDLVAWLRQMAPAALEAARNLLPNGQTTQFAMPSHQLARQAFSDGMCGVCIEAVFGPGGKSQTRIVGISIQRNGRLAVTTAEDGEHAVAGAEKVSFSRRATVLRARGIGCAPEDE